MEMLLLDTFLLFEAVPPSNGGSRSAAAGLQVGGLILPIGPTLTSYDSDPLSLSL